MEHRTHRLRPRSSGQGRAGGRRPHPDHPRGFQWPALFTVLFSLVYCGPSPDAHAAWILDYQGSLAVEEDVLKRPISIALDDTRGEICVTDAATSTIQIFDRHGLPVFHSASAVRLSLPQSTVFLTGGDLLLTDSVVGEGARRIRRLNWMGEDRSTSFEAPRAGWRPEYVLPAAEGRVLCLDTTALLLSLHGPSGALLWVSDLDEEIADALGGQDNLVVGAPALAPDGRIYLPISSGSCVLVLDGQGRRETIFGTQGSRAGQMAFPVAVGFGPEGRALVLDRIRHRLLVFDPEHAFEVEFLAFGAGPGQIYYPSCLAATASGRVLVGQGFQGRVQIYELSNTAWEPAETSGNGVGADRTATGNLGD
jgi:hypothetical protein